MEVWDVALEDGEVDLFVGAFLGRRRDIGFRFVVGGLYGIRLEVCL